MGAATPEAIAALAGALKDSDPAVRIRAAYALGLMGDSAADAAPALHEAMQDPDGAVHGAVADALSKVEPAE